MSDIDEYLKNVTPTQKAMLEKIRTIIMRIVPEAEETISYGVPTFKYNKRPLLYFAAFKDHMSIYPASDQMIKVVGQEIAKYRTGKGTFQFTEKNPIPEPMIEEIIRFRLAEISENQ